MSILLPLLLESVKVVYFSGDLCILQNIGGLLAQGFYWPNALCGLVTEWLGYWTCDQQVKGLNAGLPLSSATKKTGQINTCSSVTKQYNLVPAVGRDALRLGR